MDPNYDYSLLLREKAALKRWQNDVQSAGTYPLESEIQVDDVYTEYGFDEGEEDSVYAEVRAAVSNTDDPTMPVNTIRVWVLGSLGSILLSSVNQVCGFIDPLLFGLKFPLTFEAGVRTSTDGISLRFVQY